MGDWKTSLPLSSDLLARAHRTRGGELAWSRIDAIEVVRSLGDRDIAIIGGEVWVVEPNGRIMGVIPRVGGLGPAVFGWEFAGRKDGENWEEFRARSVDESIKMIESTDVDSEVVPGLLPWLRYNLTFMNRDRYELMYSPQDS